MAHLTNPDCFYEVFSFSDARRISGDRHRRYRNIVSTVLFPRTDQK